MRILRAAFKSRSISGITSNKFEEIVLYLRCFFKVQKGINFLDLQETLICSISTTVIQQVTKTAKIYFSASTFAIASSNLS